MTHTFSIDDQGLDPLSQWSLGPPAINQSGSHHAPITQHEDPQFSLFPPLTQNIADGTNNVVAVSDDMRRDNESASGTANSSRERVPILSGFTSVIEKANAVGFSTARTERELNLQKPALCSDATLREHFGEQVLCSHQFRAFALMQSNSPYITICHSMGKFFPSFNTGASTNIGECIAFVGDRTSQDPLPIALPNLVWNWIVPLVYKQQDDILDFYEDTENPPLTYRLQG